MNEKEYTIAESGLVRTKISSLARRMGAHLTADFILVGIRRRGVPLAERLQDALLESHDLRVEAAELTLKRYADDLSILHDQPTMDEPDLPFEMEGRTLVLVDDVVFTGRTLLKASSYLLSMGADRVFTAALCNRDMREAPLPSRLCGLPSRCRPE